MLRLAADIVGPGMHILARVEAVADIAEGVAGRRIEGAGVEGVEGARIRMVGV
jgi:Mrp family chromosome partitioning ATPase